MLHHSAIAVQWRTKGSGATVRETHEKIKVRLRLRLPVAQHAGKYVPKFTRSESDCCL